VVTGDSPHRERGQKKNTSKGQVELSYKMTMYIFSCFLLPKVVSPLGFLTVGREVGSFYRSKGCFVTVITPISQELENKGQKILLETAWDTTSVIQKAWAVYSQLCSLRSLGLFQNPLIIWATRTICDRFIICQVLCSSVEIRYDYGKALHR
jgi:hypothetical protein